MVKYTLSYFDLRGLAETARLIFTYKGVDFVDNRIPREDWPTVKPTTPSGKVPFLQVDDFVLPESFAIYLFLANRFDLAGKDEFEKAIVHATAETFRDGLQEIRPYAAVALGFAEGNKEELYKSVYLPARERVFSQLVKALAKSNSGFIAKSGLTWADFFAVESILTAKNIDADFATAFPELVAYQERVHNLPQIKEYVATRKQSPN